jgi:DNA-directed RNA polymerase subunit RPC12/RpoP
MKCKKEVEMKNTKEVTMKNGMRAGKGECPACGTKVFRILGKAK